ncbi:MAG: ParB/RepB/Spo0J family partition protein [Treponema sp.]|nr:ParB/RepB/Spo0J family partition protein [Spirochaetia bacterium]MDD7460314.1 ParB/RepB/Spo0J family partition protein [Spirochaetales bacterium]MDY5812541.1 ParB/RepB/Spo0J family partition protein [Treponema sp.]
MAKHQGLGRGISALMSEAEDDYSSINNVSNVQNDAEHQATGVQIKENAAVNNYPAGITCDENGTLWCDPKLLRPNPRQPRTYFDEEKLAELSESIRKEGVIQPVTVEDAQDGTFIIISGERRTRASLKAGMEKIPVQLKKYSDEKKLVVALIENIQRTDLNPVEEAQAYYKLMEIANLNQDQVAERVGKNRSTVANCLRLLKLPEDIQKALVEDKITSGHARAILSLDNDTDMRILYGRIQGQGLNVRQTEAMAKEMKEGHPAVPKNPAPAPDNRDPNLIAIENKIIERLGTKVQIKGDLSKGSITINYFTGDDLDRIFKLVAPGASL